MMHYYVYRVTASGHTEVLADCGRDEDRAASLAFQHDAEYGLFHCGPLWP